MRTAHFYWVIFSNYFRTLLTVLSYQLSSHHRPHRPSHLAIILQFNFFNNYFHKTLQVVVQYDKDLLEVWDEAKRLRCEWFNDYEKTASKPPMVIADLDVIQLDFRGFLSM